MSSTPHHRRGAGIPGYAIKGSERGVFQRCDDVAFDWVLEAFTVPGFDSLVGDPVTCLSGFGTKLRIPVERASCPRVRHPQRLSSTRSAPYRLNP